MQSIPSASVERLFSEGIEECSSLWTPGLAQLLVARLWRYKGRGLGPATYGSWRWLNPDPLTCRTETAILETEGSEPIVIEALPTQARERYGSLGFHLVSEPPTTEELTLCQKALALFNIGDRLLEAVVTLVRSIHVLASTSPGYDISYSDPELPCSIYVSLPTGERHAEFRLAESILHEAMHLQLTMLENEVLLIADADSVGYSPWQCTSRPISGLMHGLFVFGVIDQWLEGLGAGDTGGGPKLAYVARRRAQIAAEIGMVSQIADSPSLTPIGQKFANWLLGTLKRGSRPPEVNRLPLR